MDRTKPNGRVVGVDIIPAQPPKGVSTIQGDFLAPGVQKYVQNFLRDPRRGRPYPDIGMETLPKEPISPTLGLETDKKPGQTCQDAPESKPVDVVLSDMSAPWHQTNGFWKRSLSNPYNRMMNASGLSFRDHVGSIVCVSCNNTLGFSFLFLNPRWWLT